jgi:hypothetical protein
VPIALGAFDAVLMVKAHVEPDWRIERAVLMNTEPGQLAVEPLAVFCGGEVTVFHAPVGNCPRYTMDKLPDALLALGRAVFAVKIFADDDVCRQLAPVFGHFAIGLLEENFACFSLDNGGSLVPLDRLERIGDIVRAKDLVNSQTARAKMSCTFTAGAAHSGNSPLGKSNLSLCHVRILP